MFALRRLAGWSFVAVAAGFSLLSGAGRAQAVPIFVPDSSFTVTGTNAPTSFTGTASIKSGTQSLDGGKVDLTVSVVPTASPGSEWIAFDFSTTNGGAISQPNDNFGLVPSGLKLQQDASITQLYFQFSGSSGVLPPTSSLFFLTVVSNPVPGESGTGLLVSLPGPLHTNAVPIGIDPFGQVSDVGITAADVTGIEGAALFTVPEPLPLTVMAAGFLAIALARRRRA